MSERTRVPGKVLMLVLAVLAILTVPVIFTGCGRQPIVEQKSDANDRASADQPKVEAVAVAQTTCPIMEGNPIDKNIFVEYKGKKVYFCCAGCPDVFKANPEKYISKLPQFQN